MPRVVRREALEKFAPKKLEENRLSTKHTIRYVPGDEADDVSKMISELRTKNTTSTATASAVSTKEEKDDEPDESSARSHHENTVANENEQSWLALVYKPTKIQKAKTSLRQQAAPEKKEAKIKENPG